MTGAGHTWVTDPQGAVHSGSGDQFNVTTWVIGANERLIRAGATRLRIVQQHRRWLRWCFVRPRHYGRAAERLAEPGAVVLLNGPSGSGRRAAAAMLLEEAVVPGGRMEELPLRWEEDSLDASADDRYLLDLSGVSDTDYPDAQRSLMHYWATVEQRGARLVAVLPAGLDCMLDGTFSPLLVQLERPRGRAVLSRYLRVNGVDFDPEQLKGEALDRMFSASPMRELTRLGDLIVQARDSRRYGASFEDWCKEAVVSVTDVSNEVARQLREHRGALDRALLLAAAMAGGAASEAVLSGAHCLLNVLRHRTTPLGWPRPTWVRNCVDSISGERRTDASDSPTSLTTARYGGTSGRTFPICGPTSGTGWGVAWNCLNFGGRTECAWSLASPSRRLLRGVPTTCVYSPGDGPFRRRAGGCAPRRRLCWKWASATTSTAPTSAPAYTPGSPEGRCLPTSRAY